MKAGVAQELLSLGVVLCISVLVFVETQGFAGSSGGRISPGLFPRLAAGAMGTFALLRAMLILFEATGARESDGPGLGLRELARPVAVIAVMSVFVASFGHVTFLLLAPVFLAAIFYIAGSRSWVGLVLKACISAVILYVLFFHLLRIAE